MTRLLLLPGDGIGPEIAAATRRVIETADARFDLGLSIEEADIGLDALARHGTTLPDTVFEAAKAADAIVLGPISHLDYPPREKGGINVSAALRVGLDLYANIRPARGFAGVPRRGSDIDLVVVREGTEGFYPDRNMVAGSGEFMPTPDVALSVRKITAQGSRRIAETAFRLAAARRGRVTAVHKAAAFRLTDGLFLDQVRAVAADHPEVRLDEMIVDAMAAHLVRDASGFDVVLCTNFHGDILSDLAAELAGGLGLAGAINAGTTRCVAQAQHGSAPDIAGRDLANPTGLILSTTMLFDWLAANRRATAFSIAASAINAAIAAALARPETRTRDLGGPLGTRAFGEAIARRLI